jgi:ABC-2 type transport system permease protein
MSRHIRPRYARDVTQEIGSRFRGLRLVGHQFRYDQKVFWRNPAAIFFTVLFPLLFLFGLATFFGDHRIAALGDIKVSTYYVPAILVLSIIAATLVSLAFRLTQARESGLLKRIRGTPLPSTVFIAGRVGNSLVISAIMVVLIGAIGHLVYGVKVPTSTLPALIVSVVVGAAAFSCLGFALAALIPNEDAAPAITNAIVFPLYFLSGIFVPENEIPDGVLRVAGVFPVRPLFEAIFKAYDPATTGAGFAVGDLAVVAAWGLAGLVAALIWFRWEPRSN